MRTRLSVTLYVNCTSCYLYLTYKHPSTSVLGSGILLSTSYGHCCTGNGSITSHGTATHKAILSSTILNLGSKLRWTASCPGHLTPPPPYYPMNTRQVPQDLWQVRFTTRPTDLVLLSVTQNPTKVHV